MKCKKSAKFFSGILVLAILVSSLSSAFVFSASAESTSVTYDYSAIEDQTKLHIKDYNNTLNMYDGVGLKISGGAVVTDLDWRWQVNSVDQNVELSGAYAIYNIVKNTEFKATFTETTDLSKVQLLVSRDMVTWYDADITTDGKTVTIGTPNAVSFVKIVWSLDNNADCGLISVTYTKAEEALEKQIDYSFYSSDTTGLGSGNNDNSVLVNRGVWQSNGLDLTNGGLLQPNWTALDNANTENSYNGYVTYKVQPGTRFGLTVTSNRGTSTVATRLGYENPLDWRIRIYGSADNESFEEIDVTPAYSARYANNQGNADARRSADYNFIVPDGVVYIKCRFPLTQDLRTLMGTDGTAVWPYVGNDLFEINKVEFTQLKYDYYQAGENDYYITSSFSADTKADFGIYNYEGGFNREGSGLFDTNWDQQYYYGHGGTSVTYNVKPGTAFYAGFKREWAGGLQGYIALKDFVIKLQGYDEATSSWVDVGSVTVTNDTYDSSKVYYTACITAEQNSYKLIRIAWPGKANNNYLGDDYMKLAEVAFTQYSETAIYKNGDFNGDNEVDILDYVRLKKIIAGQDVSDGADPDINGNGLTNSVDLSLLRKFLLGVISAL